MKSTQSRTGGQVVCDVMVEEGVDAIFGMPGGASLHNCMIPHGPSPESFEAASAHDLSPQHIDSGISFMFESRHPYRVTDHAMTGGALQTDYPADWQGLKRQFTG